MLAKDLEFIFQWAFLIFINSTIEPQQLENILVPFVLSEQKMPTKSFISIKTIIGSCED